MWQRTRPRLSLVLMVMTLASAALDADAKVISVTDGPNPGARCSSTGPTCRDPYDCYYLPDGEYQWCGGCEFVLRCHGGGYGYLHMTGDINYTVWDDNKKAFDMESTTCSECYVTCPPWATVQPEQGSSRCNRTGPTCVPDVSFCSSVVGAKKFQHCDYCHTYVDCTGNVETSIINYCPGGTRFDDNAKDCLYTSYTCVECYQPCTGNETHTGTEGPPIWETTRESHVTTATSRLLTTLMSTTTTSQPEGGGPEGEGPGGCGSGSLVVKLEGKDVKLELDLRINPPSIREKTDAEKQSGEHK